MSTQRYISTSFWDDEWVQELNITEKALYLYLLTNTLTNIAGVYKISDRRISFDTGLPEEELKSILDKFKKAGKAYRTKEFVIIPSWPKHQKWETHSKIRVGIESTLKKLPKEILLQLKNIGYTYPIDSLCIGFDKEAQSETEERLPSNYSDLNSNININTDTDLKEPVFSFSENNISKQGMIDQAMSELGQPPPLDGGAVFNKARELWNELELPPECRDLIISIPPVRMQEVLSTFQKYSCDEVLNAIRNYNWHRKKLGSDDNKGWRDVLNFGSLIGFLKTGVEKYFDDEGFEKLYKKGA